MSGFDIKRTTVQTTGNKHLQVGDGHNVAENLVAVHAAETSVNGVLPLQMELARSGSGGWVDIAGLLRDV